MPRKRGVGLDDGPHIGLNDPNLNAENTCKRCCMGLPVFDDSITDDEMDLMVDNATTASNFLKAVSHEGRLLILCHLVTGEKSVTELEDLLSARQAAVSQQLSRLRLEGLVVPRRDGKAIYYRLADDRPRRILELVYELFCADDKG
ncbi:Biofilm growth-associated repressor [Thalassovita gelatinovora]|uniref:Biofilm growth-associated repressor n=2 Tax=Thalassovita gelatinovora TaxID=53501 RepID=A0A0P1FE82_THAGE|nr:Biofilm growth-associated repressor [Thalassovita gelatinovora]SER13884.1 transcriptional regulator, ArsR family [Thalassovita gelatinovora]